jgi:hypothetical protein
MITIENVDINDEEFQDVRNLASTKLTLWQYRRTLILSPYNLMIYLAIIVISYYAVRGYFDPPPCCDYDGRDHFSWSLRLGFVGMWAGVIYQAVRALGTSKQGYQDVMAAVARARATEASRKVWTIRVTLDETTFGVSHEHGLFLFSADPNGGTRLLEILTIADDIREPLAEGAVQPCEWHWRQLPGSAARSALVTSGPNWQLPIYEISHDAPLRRFFDLLEEATPIQDGHGFDLALFSDPPATLESRIAALDDAAWPDTRSRTSNAA